jgi:hypothetical protein
MMVQYLFILAALFTVSAFTIFGAFFLCYVWLYYQYGSCTPKAVTLAEHMASGLYTQAMKLGVVRLQMFLDWLQRHCRGLETKCIKKNESDIQVMLRLWLETFPPDDLHCEYQLLISEITWWRDADEKTLLRCVSQEFIERYSSQ